MKSYTDQNPQSTQTKKKTSPSNYKEPFSTYLEINARYWCMSNGMIIYPHPKRSGKVINIELEVVINGKSHWSGKKYTNKELSHVLSKLYMHLFNKYGRKFFDKSIEHRILKSDDLNK